MAANDAEAFDRYETRVRRFVVVHLLTMGLGGIRQAIQDDGVWGGPVLSCHQVKQMLLGDEHLLTECVDEVHMIFDAAVTVGHVRADDAAPWLRLTARYVTWRRARVRARELFREPLGLTASAEESETIMGDTAEGDDHPGADPESRMIIAEARLESERRLRALFAVLPSLGPIDEALIRGRLAGEDYETIAARLEKPTGMLRIRMHRGMAKLRPLIEARLRQEGSRWETGTDIPG